jgi:thrombospondin type 3 repeat protein
MFPHGRESRRFGGSLAGAGRIFAGVAAALTLIGLSLAGLQSDVLGMRSWPGSGNQSPRTQLLPDHVPLVTRLALPGPKVGPAGGAVATVAQPASPTASSTPLRAPNGTPSTTGPAAPADTVVTNPDEQVVPPTNVPQKAVDSDGDGLSDATERSLGTDPHRRDTDGDGLPDGWEVANGLNPRLDLDAVRDPDSDGLDNRNEYLVRMNPRSTDSNADGISDGATDSDGDGLPNAVEQTLGLDPAAGSTPPSRREPVRNATSLSMPEASPDVVVQAVKTGGAGSAPTAPGDDGALDSDGDGIPNALEVKLGTNPASSQEQGAAEAAADSDGDGIPNALEVRLALDPTQADSDGNGVPDGAEDSDGDGIPNAMELKLGLDPSRADSDGDGVGDGDIDSDADGTSNVAELAVGRDPSVPDTPPAPVETPATPVAPAPEPPAPEQEPGDDSGPSSPEQSPAADPVTAPAPPVDTPAPPTP